MKPIKTEDGAHTFYIEALDEYYHSIYGAFQESETVFINAGLKATDKNELVIFEMGFGTGLNAFMSYLEAKKSGRNIQYFGIEAHPILLEDAMQLNYPKELGTIEDKAVFNTMHQAPWGQLNTITPSFYLQKMQQQIQTIELGDMPTFDLVYFDAFAPSAQPDLWSKAIFQKLYNHMNEGAILVTYCAKGVVKRTLKEVGFRVEGLPGPKGKREMTRAIKF